MHTPFKKYLGAISILGALGMLISAYLLYLHYANGAISFCNFDKTINCDLVNRSKYAEIFGLPVSGLGLLGYFVLTLMSHGWHMNWFKKPTHHKMLVLSTGALAFSLYLTFIEFYVLKALCPLCLTSQIVILTIFILSLIIWLKYTE